MNRELAQAVVAVFQARSGEAVARGLGRFNERDWLCTREWLHTSGLALYLIDRVMKLGADAVIPSRIATELRVNLGENRVRTADLFGEFVSMNVELQRSGILYANLKGFTLAPVACPDPALRYQHDLDFLVARRDAERCRQTLMRHGYVQTAVSGDSWEFHAGGAEVCDMRDLYRVRAQRSAEIHLVPEAEEESPDARLSRLQLQVWNGFEFPALSESDKLLAQAMHIFQHFQSEWTRTAWLLEYATAIRADGDNVSLWRDVEATLGAMPQIRTGVGIASLVTGRSFPLTLPDELVRTVQTVPPQARLWACRYERELVFTEHPGSKLYLLLMDVLFDGNPEWPRRRRRRLWPRRMPPKKIVAKGESLAMNLRIKLQQMKFVLLRLWFHIASGLRYRMEAARWRRFLAEGEL